MHQKFSLSLTESEARELLMTRVERSLQENGVTLTQEARTQIAACLPMPEAIGVVQGETDRPPTRPTAYKPTIQEARAALETTHRATPAQDASNRARIYRATRKASPVANASSTTDKVLNLILRSEVCTLPDLLRGTHRPKKALYTALWQLKKDGLIETAPLSTLTDAAHNN